MPAATAGAFKPEPVLEEAEYQHILEVIDNMVKVMERSPKAFHDIDEEALRTHFLVQLNGHYEGQATGETFNYQGKTDILIRSGDRNIFIGECKILERPCEIDGDNRSDPRLPVMAGFQGGYIAIQPEQGFLEGLRRNP